MATNHEQGTSPQEVDVEKVLDAIDQVLTGRLTKLRREYERSIARGLQPHMVVANKAERMEYLRDSLRAVRDTVAALLITDSGKAVAGGAQ